VFKSVLLNTHIGRLQAGFSSSSKTLLAKYVYFCESRENPLELVEKVNFQPGL
jgi:hypothetical protein